MSFDDTYPALTTPPVLPAGEVARQTSDPMARHEELLAAYRSLRNADPGGFSDAGYADITGPAVDNLFDRMQEQGIVRVADDGSETIQLHAPRHSPNGGELTFTRSGVDTDGSPRTVVMTFAETPFTTRDGETWQRGHSVIYDPATNTLRPFQGGPQFNERGYTSGTNVGQWLSNILQGRTDSEFAADEVAIAQERQAAVDRRTAEAAASLGSIATLRAASWLRGFSPKVIRARREHNLRYGS